MHKNVVYNVQALKHLGNYINNSAFAAFHELSNRAFGAFHEHVGEAEPKPLTDLVRRMIYVAEATSVALRLNASWALTHPSFSLCRDRYEQCARFSWLTRQSDDREWFRYIADMYLRRDRLKRSFEKRGIVVPELENAAFDELPDDKKKSFRHWDNLSLEQLVERRDNLKGITNTDLDRQALLSFYESIYRQGSSVSHYDLYSIQMLGIYDAPDGGKVLAADPGLPIVTVLHCALFDMIQCAEALARVSCPAPEYVWNAANDDWWTYVKRTGIMEIGKDAEQ